MQNHAVIISAALACLIVSAGNAAAQDCLPHKLLATLAMGSAEPVSGIRTVPVAINGAEKQMLLDTGGAITQISRNTIAELGLPMRLGGAAVYDINGRVSHQFTVVRDFRFGDLSRIDAALPVWPDPVRPYAGELAQDMLQPYGVEIDFGANLLRMYSRNHCPGPPGWPHGAYSRLEMSNRGWHLHIPVTLDGHTYDAIFDTGSRHTIMRLQTAKRDFGLSAPSPDLAAYPAINGDPFLEGQIHVFAKLSLGGIVIERPAILIVPDIMNRNADRSPMARNRTIRHNAGLVLPELSIGMDVLKQLHLYMAFGEGALYIAPAEKP